jgi:hypothetical protein
MHQGLTLEVSTRGAERGDSLVNVVDFQKQRRRVVIRAEEEAGRPEIENGDDALRIEPSDEAKAED